MLQPLTICDPRGTDVFAIAACATPTVTIPRATEDLLRQVLREGFPGFVALVSQTSQDTATELATLIKDDKLLTSQQMSRPHWLASAEKLVPFLSQQAVLPALAITNPEVTDLNVALRMM